MTLREGRAGLLAGILIHLLFLASLGTQLFTPLFIEAQHARGQAGDYFGIYQAGDNLVHGTSIYDYEGYQNEAQRRVPYFYFYRYLPPCAYLAALSALVLSPWAGYWVWVIVTELLLLLVVLWILRLDGYPIGARRLYAGLWLGFFPFLLEQWMGQFSFLMAVFLWILLRQSMPDRPAEPPRGRAFWAWCASVALKSYTALFALPFLRRRWVRPVAACAAVVVLVSAPYYIARPEDLRQFLFVNFRPLPPGVLGGSLGASAFVRMLGWLLPQAVADRLLDFKVFDVYLGNVPVFIVDLLVVAGALWSTFGRRRAAALHIDLSIWTLAFFLVFQDVWEYHYVMLLPVVTALGLASRSRFVLLMGLLLALPTPYILFARADHSLAVAPSLLHHASKALPSYALYLWAVRNRFESEWKSNRLDSSHSC